MILVGDRGMITQARITEDIGSAGLDWITALRAPAIKRLVDSGALQLSLFDQRDMASITAPDFPGERLVVCRNPDLAAERTRKREDLLAATERDLARIQTAVVRKRDPLRGTAEIALAVGAVINKHKMAKHFELDITDAAFSFARKTTEIAAEAATMASMSSAPACRQKPSTMRRRCAATSHSPSWNAPFAASRPSICTCGRSITDWPIGSARMSSSACSPITSNGTCASASRRCCSTTPTKQRPRHGVPAWWRRRSAHRGLSPSRSPA